MPSIRAALARVVGLFYGRRRDGELAAELDAHLQAHIHDKMCAGMTTDEARRDALRTLGGVEQTKEQIRDRRGAPVLDTIVQDIRYAVRALRKAPGFAIAALAALALGIGGVTPHDWVAFIAAALLLSAVALVACWLPARRAASVDPVIALRTD